MSIALTPLGVCIRRPLRERARIACHRRTSSDRAQSGFRPPCGKPNHETRKCQYVSARAELLSRRIVKRRNTSSPIALADGGVPDSDQLFLVEYPLAFACLRYFNAFEWGVLQVSSRRSDTPTEERPADGEC